MPVAVITRTSGMNGAWVLIGAFVPVLADFPVAVGWRVSVGLI